MVEITHRNKKGETPYSIASEHKYEKVEKVLKLFLDKIGDITKETTNSLLDDLLKEEERKEQEKAKKKEKKKKNKLKHIAEKEGLSVEELAAKHEAENEAKRLEDERKRQEEEDRLRREFEEAVAEQTKR